MEEVKKLLKENRAGYGDLATVAEDKPKVRPFGYFLFEGKEGALYFCTATDKDVYQQLQERPYIEFTITSPTFVTLRLNGKITFSNNRDIKEKILDKMDLVRAKYKTADNPLFSLFYLDQGEAIISDFSGQPPRKFEFAF